MLNGSRVECEGDICILGRYVQGLQLRWTALRAETSYCKLRFIPIGRLTGAAHAGSRGDRRAVIRVQHLDSDQVQIAGIRATSRLSLDQATLVICSPEGHLELRPQQSASQSCREDNDTQPEVRCITGMPRSDPLNPTLRLGLARSEVIMHWYQVFLRSSADPLVLEPNASFLNLLMLTYNNVQNGSVQLPPFSSSSTGSLKKSQRRVSKQSLEAASLPAKAALLTGLYIFAAGLALMLAPLWTFTLLFDQR